VSSTYQPALTLTGVAKSRSAGAACSADQCLLSTALLSPHERSVSQDYDGEREQHVPRERPPVMPRGAVNDHEVERVREPEEHRDAPTQLAVPARTEETRRLRPSARSRWRGEAVHATIIRGVAPSGGVSLTVAAWNAQGVRAAPLRRPLSYVRLQPRSLIYGTGD